MWFIIGNMSLSGVQIEAKLYMQLWTNLLWLHNQLLYFMSLVIIHLMFLQSKKSITNICNNLLGWLIPTSSILIYQCVQYWEPWSTCALHVGKPVFEWEIISPDNMNSEDLSTDNLCAMTQNLQLILSLHVICLLLIAWLIESKWLSILAADEVRLSVQYSLIFMNYGMIIYWYFQLPVSVSQSLPV